MKQLFITLKEAIKKGILWIFPKSLQDEFTFFQKLLICSIILTLFCILVGCGTTRQVAVVDRFHQDTIYINQTQYDSIFIQQQHSSDYHLNPLNPLKQSETDTLFVKDIQIEYRYKLLRDTIKQVRVDSIPVIKEVEVTREVRYIPWWSKALNYIGAITLVILTLLILKKIYLK